MTSHLSDVRPEVPAQPRPFVCVIEELHRDPEVAADARDGVFTHAGRRLHLGRTPDWLHGGLADDEEWRIEWVKLYEGLALAHDLVERGDRDSLTTWEDLVESFCDQVPVGHDTSDVSARRIQNWLYAWQRFAEAPAWQGLRPGLAERLTDRLLADGEHLRHHLTPARNHRTLELYALLVLALAFGRDEDAVDAIAALAENAGTDVHPDGVHIECSSDYHLIVLRSFVGAIANARLVGLPVPHVLEQRTRAMCNVALHLQRPDGITPALSDGDQADHRSLLRRAGVLLDRPDLLWAATDGAEGVPPATRAASFPVGGYHVQRSGWGDAGRALAEERWSVLDCGPLGAGGHGHYDQLSVELMAEGHEIAVDPGRYTYAEDGSGWRAWFKGTAAHNTVTVDGLDQTPYRRGKPKGPTSTARLLWRHTGHGLDALCGQVVSPRYDAVHTRTLALVDDDYWVVLDRLRAPDAHDYAARWHLGAEAQGRVDVARYEEQSVVTTPHSSFVVPTGCGHVGLEPGWVSPTYGIKHPAPVVLVTAEAHADADLVTVITPGTEAPGVWVRHLDETVLVDVEPVGGRPVRLHLAPTWASLESGQQVAS
ncbi:MAG TPA: alginate lyase family protein [Marmoricola sp.]|nr:alginate lyase family protein [Marmoricola sp.]